MREENKSYWGMMQGNTHTFCDSIKVVAFNIFILFDRQSQSKYYFIIPFLPLRKLTISSYERPVGYCLQYKQ